MNKINYIKNFLKMNKHYKVIFLRKFLNKYKLNTLLIFWDKFIKNKKISYSNVNSLFNINDINVNKIDDKLANYLWTQYSSHHFNLLGSGWVNGNRSNNLQKASKNYKEIAWNKDLKNNYLFENEYSYRIVKVPSGVDVKFPWELSRMYHLPQLALISKKRGNENIEIVREFKNQVIDFNKNNKYGIGINWKSTMDVSIRSVNILIAYDLFRPQDYSNVLDSEFKDSFFEMMIHHGRFIYSNLELNFLNGKNGNHYLSNLCALLFISSYISTNETKKWYEFSKKEIIKEFKKQFFEDGSSYECSTAYHRLSSELIFYSFGILVNNEEVLDEECINKLSKIAEFAELYTYKNLKFSQIGDNDSGRLIKIFPKGEFYSTNNFFEKYSTGKNDNKLDYVFVEDELRSDILFIGSHILGVYNDCNYSIKTIENSVEFDFFNTFVKQKIFLNIPDNKKKLNEKKDLTLNNYTKNFEREHKITFTNLSKGLEDNSIRYSSSFGLIKVSNDSFTLLIRTVPKLEEMLRAHLHDDFLNFEIFYDNNIYFCDPGSYVYTESREKRNYFRSSKAHNVPKYKIDFNDFINVFNVESEVRGELLKLTSEEIKIKMIFKGVIHERTFYFSGNELTILDESNQFFDFELNDSHVSSEGYGKLINSKFRLGKKGIMVEKLK